MSRPENRDEYRLETVGGDFDGLALPVFFKTQAILAAAETAVIPADPATTPGRPRIIGFDVNIDAAGSYQWVRDVAGPSTALHGAREFGSAGGNNSGGKWRRWYEGVNGEDIGIAAVGGAVEADVWYVYVPAGHVTPVPPA